MGRKRRSSFVCAFAEGLRVEQLPQAAEARAAAFLVERSLRKNGGKVDQDRDRIANRNLGDVAAAELNAAVQLDSGTPTTGSRWHRNIDQTAALRPDAPKCGAATVAELGLGAASQDSRHQVAEGADL
jgi:hypothetical protein